MVLSKRYYCITYDNGERECFNDDSFWYSDVRTYPPTSTTMLGENDTNTRHTDGHHNQVDHPCLLLLHLLRMVRHRSHARKATIEEGPPPARLPPRMSTTTAMVIHIAMDPHLANKLTCSS